MLLDLTGTRRRLGKWLSAREAMAGGFELHYEFRGPRVVAERYMDDDSGGLRDYKFVTFDGEVRFMLVIQNCFAGELSGAYNARTREPMPFSYGFKVGTRTAIPLPAFLDEMRGLAERLGLGFSFARADFYEVDARTVFGEITFTEANELLAFDPADYDLACGQKLTLSEKKAFKGIVL